MSLALADVFRSNDFGHRNFAIAFFSSSCMYRMASRITSSCVMLSFLAMQGNSCFRMDTFISRALVWYFFNTRRAVLWDGESVAGDKENFDFITIFCGSVLNTKMWMIFSDSFQTTSVQGNNSG